MHITTKALVLRTVDYKETDKILTLLTQDQGKLTASARGCRKKGSAIAAGCQLLAWSEMVLYDYQGRWAVKEAATQRLFQGVRDDIQRLALGCYFAEMTELLAAGFIDSFRTLYPDKTGAYSWWSYQANARANNTGWRIDYFVLSQRLRESLAGADIFPEIMGSDHCPVGVTLDLT